MYHMYILHETTARVSTYEVLVLLNIIYIYIRYFCLEQKILKEERRDLFQFLFIWYGRGPNVVKGVLFEVLYDI